MTSLPDFQKMMDEGFELLEQCDYDGAIKLGKKLQRLRHSSNFEILALAYCAKGKLKKAIKILEEGVSKAPCVWRLWQLLGNYLSDEERFVEAHQAYRRALKCPTTNPSSIELYRAIVLARQKKLSKALQCLKRVNDAETVPRAKILKVDILTDLGRLKEAVHLGRKAVKLKKSLSSEERARAFAKLGIAELKSGMAKQALARAWRAVAINKTEPEALWLIREIEANRSEKSKYYRMIIEGTWFGRIEGSRNRPGFFINYDVVAETEKEGLEYVKRFVPAEVRKTLQVSEARVLQKRPHDPKGVYRASGYAFFPKRQKKSAKCRNSG